MSDEKQEKAEVPNFGVITVTLSYEDYPVFAFKFKRALTKYLKDLKQTFYGLKKEEQEAQLKGHRIEILSKLLIDRPTGLDALGYGKELNPVAIYKDFEEFMKRPENDQLLEDLWVVYQGKIYPKELLLEPSE